MNASRLCLVRQCAPRNAEGQNAELRAYEGLTKNFAKVRSKGFEKFRGLTTLPGKFEASF